MTPTSRALAGRLGTGLTDRQKLSLAEAIAALLAAWKSVGLGTVAGRTDADRVEGRLRAVRPSGRAAKARELLREHRLRAVDNAGLTLMWHRVDRDRGKMTPEQKARIAAARAMVKAAEAAEKAAAAARKKKKAAAARKKKKAAMRSS